MRDIMTVEQAAEYLQLNPETVRRAARKGEIPAGRVGRRWRFRKSALDRWLGQSATEDEEATERAVRVATEDAMARSAARQARFAAWQQRQAERKAERKAEGGDRSADTGTGSEGSDG